MADNTSPQTDASGGSNIIRNVNPTVAQLNPQGRKPSGYYKSPQEGMLPVNKPLGPVYDARYRQDKKGSIYSMIIPGIKPDLYAKHIRKQIRTYDVYNKELIKNSMLTVNAVKNVAKNIGDLVSRTADQIKGQTHIITTINKLVYSNKTSNKEQAKTTANIKQMAIDAKAERNKAKKDTQTYKEDEAGLSKGEEQFINSLVNKLAKEKEDEKENAKYKGEGVIGWAIDKIASIIPYAKLGVGIAKIGLTAVGIGWVYSQLLKVPEFKEFQSALFDAIAPKWLKSFVEGAKKTWGYMKKIFEE